VAPLWSFAASTAVAAAASVAADAAAAAGGAGDAPAVVGAAAVAVAVGVAAAAAEGIALAAASLPRTSPEATRRGTLGELATIVAPAFAIEVAPAASFVWMEPSAASTLAIGTPVAPNCVVPDSAPALTVVAASVFVAEPPALGAFAPWAEEEWKLPSPAAEPFAGTCCSVCGGAAAGFAADWGELAGVDPLASSKAAKGCESVS